MFVDLPGRVRNTQLPVTRPLLPLIDAVVNAIHAIEDADRSDGRIEIRVDRDDSQVSIPDTRADPVASFTVIDNGIGFTEENFASFQTPDTTLKLSKGGKGIGRFLWLKAFERTRVVSVFRSGNALAKRSFDFTLSGDGIANHQHLEVENTDSGTTVLLESMKPQYRKHCPLGLEIIARKLIQHCMAYFLSPACPQIELSDGTDRIPLNRLFRETIVSTSTTRVFSVKGQQFTAVHLPFYSSDEPRHKIHYCANNREVYDENLSGMLPDLQGRLLDGSGEPFFAATYISGQVLDAAVNNERTDFVLGDFDMEMFPEEITKTDLRTGAVAEVRDFLAPFLDVLEKKKLERIEAFVQTRAPQYRPLLKHGREQLSAIPASVTDEGLDLELHKVKLRCIADLKKEGAVFLAQDPETLQNTDEYRAQYRRFASQLSEFVKSELAEYIVHRKMVLDLLQRALELQETGRYALEENVHELIFPLRSTSDDINYENQNLWVVDEKLSYHRYLASDKPLSSAEPIQVDSRDRPDIPIFNTPFAFVEDERPFSSIVIVEFKRPLRDRYPEEDNPIDQVYGYIRLIRDGKALDRAGRPIPVASTTPFYCYILCDLTARMRGRAENANMLATPDGLGFFGYNSVHGAYIEVVSYDKVVGDAKTRNQILFDKLCLPTK